jgi:hypothetical protein
VQRKREQVVEVQGVLAVRQRLVQHLPRGGVRAGDVAAGVDADQALGGLVGRVAGPGQVQPELAGGLHDQHVLDAAHRQGRQVPQLGPLHGLHAAQVEHADAVAPGPEERRAGAAVDAGVVEEVLAAVQPHRFLLGQRGADGGGADRAFRKIDPDPADVPRVAAGGVGAVGQRAHVDHDAGGVGQDREIACVGNGAGQPGDHRPGGRDQRPVALGQFAHGRRGHRVEAHPLLRAAAGLDAALPGAGDPGVDAQGAAGARHIALEQLAPGLGNGQGALGRRRNDRGVHRAGSRVWDGFSWLTGRQAVSF